MFRSLELSLMMAQALAGEVQTGSSVCMHVCCPRVCTHARELGREAVEASSLEGGYTVLGSASLIATLCTSLLEFSMAARQVTHCLPGWGIGRRGFGPALCRAVLRPFFPAP